MNWLQRLFGHKEAPLGTFTARAQRQPPAQPPATLPSLGTSVAGRASYTLLQVLGEGSYGTVFLAEPDDPALPRRVAVKLLNPRLTAQARSETLRRELSSLLAVEHAAIPRVYDWSLQDPAFVAMEFFAAGSLEARLEREGMLPDDDLIRLFEDLLAALSAARRAGLLHLDIKPGNVLVREGGGFALADFGTARAAFDGGDASSTSKGSRGYQAPEQASREAAVDLRTDLYGVGATVWSAATGIDLGSPQGLGLLGAHRIAPTTLPRIRTVRPLVAPRVDDLLAPLLSRNPTERPADPATVRAHLQAYNDDRGALSSRGVPLGPDDAAAVHNALLDPLWAHILRDTSGADLRRFAPGTVLVEQGETSHHAFVLLQGTVRVTRGGTTVATLRREGTFLGEVAALTGGQRTARMNAEDDVVVLVLDLMDLERLVTGNPAVGVRLIHAMADRLAHNV